MRTTIKTSDLLGAQGSCFVRYCPDDGNITVLSKPIIGPGEGEIDITVVNNKDIFMLIFSEQLKRDNKTYRFTDSPTIHMKKYDAKKDVWKSKASKKLRVVLYIVVVVYVYVFAMRKSLFFLNRLVVNLMAPCCL